MAQFNREREEIDPDSNTSEERTEEMAVGGAETAAYGVPGAVTAGGMQTTAAAAIAGQLAADALIRDEENLEDTDTNNADSGDSFAGEGNENPEGPRHRENI